MPRVAVAEPRPALPVLDADATRALLPAGPLVEAVAAAMRARRAGHLQAPERQVLGLPGDGRYLVMPAADDTLAIAKLVCVHPGNPALGRPALQGQVLVSDARDGRALMLLDGPTLTARRTAAVTALALCVLAPSARAVLLVGTGAQARAHAQLLAELGAVDALHLVGRTPARAQAFAEALAADGLAPRTVVHATAAAALPHVQAVVTLTGSLRPVLPDAVPPACVVVGVGAFTPAMAELPPGLLRGRRVLVDAHEAARHEAGDLLQAGIDWSSVDELVDVLDGAVVATGPAPVFKSVGHAAWDLAAAHVAWRQRQAGPAP